MGGLKKRGSQPSSMLEDGVDTVVALEHLERVKADITRINKSIRKQVNAIEAHELQCRLDVLNKYIEKAFDLQQQVERTSPNLSSREELEELCILAKTGMMSAKTLPQSQGSSKKSTPPASSSHSRQLPQMKLPKFGGNYADYKNFIGLFTSLIDNDPTLSNVEKFNHLLSCLEKEALGTVKAYQVTDTNYSKALAALNLVYDNPCLIFFESIARLFDIPAIQNPSAVALRSLIDTVKAIYESLLSIGDNTKIANAMIIHIVMSKVDRKTRARWEEQIDYQTIPTWQDCEDAMNKRYQHLAADEATLGRSKPLKSNAQRNTGKTSLSVAQVADPPNHKCVFCKSNEHFIHSCTSFANASVESRFKFVKGFPLCINCLRNGHSVSSCKASHCRVCSKPHHTLLHRYSSHSAANAFVSPHQTQQSLKTSSVNHAQTEKASQVVLATALVDISGQAGQKQIARVLLDSGSQVNFITEELAKSLQLKRYRHDINLLGIGKSQLSARHAVQTTVSSRCEPFEMVVDLIVLKSISSYHPEKMVTTADWKIPENIVFADPLFHKPQRVDMLLGADTFFDLLKIGQIKHFNFGPTLQNTVFGWIVSGRCKTTQPQLTEACSMLSMVQDSCPLDSLVRKFWEVEQVPEISKSQLYTPEQALCEKSFVDTVVRLPSGRFSVSLPFRSSPSCLGRSYDTAKRRFLSLERRMNANPDLQSMYIDFMKEYLALGHMTATDNVVPANPHYFIPYQCVVRLHSASTKLRCVFDASSRTTSQLSLNDLLLVGPTIQPCLYAILLKFRLRPYAMTADITKMYRQVIVNEAQRDFQLIVWREHNTEPLQIYRLNTVTYGTASAPFLAIRCLQQLSELYAVSHPSGSKLLANDFYVDDLVSGADSIEELKSLREEVIYILESAGFVLAKWATNCDLSDNQNDNTDVSLGDTADTKTLGLTWSPKQDVFRFRTQELCQDNPPTKRSILSFTARLFDPLGLLCPIITLAKILIQEIWLLKLDWDDQIPNPLFQRWEAVIACFEELDSIKIPRHVGTNRTGTYQVHGFADASTDAYGCCLYVRSVNPEGVLVNLLTAKSRVAPLKTKTVPRLELCAAHLLAKLWDDVRKLIDFKVEHVFMWSDSEVVLHWLQTHPSKLKTFVANRVADIQELSPDAVWRHVPTDVNPADLPSRGCTVKELNKSLWFNGPPFLLLEQNQWPKNSHLQASSPEMLAENRTTATAHIVVDCNPNPILKIVDDFSSYLKIIRIVAYISRFVDGRKSACWTQSVPTATELALSFLTIVQVVQRDAFTNEFDRLSKSLVLQPSYQKLNPFVCTEHIGKRNLSLLRVGGRLLQAPLAHNAKFPLLMPKSNRFVKLYIQHLHRTNCHAGPRALVGLLRQSIWLINARRECSAVVRQCVHCFRYKPRLLSQIMGNLPVDRLLGSRPFRVSGVDLFGPIRVSLGIRGKAPLKMYCAVFVCFASKAVHLELIKDLTSNSFLLCLTRFLGRRGPLEKLYCDNATNFVGSARMLQDIANHFETNKDALMAFSAPRQFEFVFIPPRAPHFGGLWEAAVKSAKHLLIKAVGNALLKEDELQTVLVEVEAVLNSRPIAADSNSPNDGEAITPAHFLVGTTLATLPPAALPSRSDDNLTCLQRWHLVSAIKQRFWRDWSRDYLLGLQQRVKWTKESSNIKEGAIVVIREDNLPPQMWLLGVVVGTITGTDGKVRVATVKTKSGIFKRAIHHLAPLPTF